MPLNLLTPSFVRPLIIINYHHSSVETFVYTKTFSDIVAQVGRVDAYDAYLKVRRDFAAVHKVIPSPGSSATSAYKVQIQ
jgi:hypothetical protein